MRCSIQAEETHLEEERKQAPHQDRATWHSGSKETQNTGHSAPSGLEDTRVCMCDSRAHLRGPGRGRQGQVLFTKASTSLDVEASWIGMNPSHGGYQISVKPG